MPIVNTGSAGFYAGRIGSTDTGLPVYLYFEPASGQFRPVIVPPIGDPYYAPQNAIIRHDADRVSPLASAVVFGAIGAILGGGPGAAAGAALGALLSNLGSKQAQNGAA
jgi:hypothetical protein